MKISPPKLNQQGSGLLAVLAVLFFIATSLFFIFFLIQPKGGSPGGKNSKNALQDAKIEKLMGEMSQLFTSLGDVERMKDRRKYLEITGVAAKKLIEADDLWETRTKTQKGLADGMMGGLNENYEAHFTRAEKFQMLSEKYGLPVAKLRLMKADLEVMFADEIAEKFAPAPEAPPEEAKEKGTQDAANAKGGKT